MSAITNLHYGWIDIRKDGDEYVIDRADPIVAFTAELFIALCADGVFTWAECNDLLIGGQVRYRPIGVDPSGNFAFQRIDD